MYNISGKKIFTHPEEQPGYTPDPKYLPEHNHRSYVDLPVNKEGDGSSTHEPSPLLEAGSNNDDALQRMRTRELDNDEEKPHSDNGYVKVDWDGPNDPENPKNWPSGQKLFFLVQMGFLTTSIYIGSSIYIPGVEQIMQDFNVSQTVGYLPLSLFVLGYGIGPMILSPLSEHAAIGRVYIYIITLAIFVILQIPTALSKNIASMLVLRFLAGFFASPALATGGASVGDVITLARIPEGLASWGVCATSGPVLGPLIGGALAQEVNWRWTIWFLLIMDGFALVSLTFFFPETSAETLLYRKAQRLRTVTSNPFITSEGHIKISQMTAKETAIDTLWRPIEISFSEPVVFLINVYIALMYAILYLWFEAFPIVFVELHGFNILETGLGYISNTLGVLLGCLGYLPVLHYAFTKPMEEGKNVAPEVFLPSSIVAAVLQPTGVFIFAWSATASAHWIGPLIGALIFAIGSFVGFQTLFNYLAFSFPRYRASVFASNSLFRAGLASTFPLFANALYKNLGSKKFPVGWGCSVLGFINAVMILIPVLFYINGVKLRARSKYAN